MHQVCNIVPIQNDPFRHIHDGIKNVTYIAESKGDDQVEEELAMPLHP